MSVFIRIKILTDKTDKLQRKIDYIMKLLELANADMKRQVDEQELEAMFDFEDESLNVNQAQDYLKKFMLKGDYNGKPESN
mgnify:CR=1 FL=1